MRMYVVQTTDTGDQAALRNAARDGRAAAMRRRRQLSQGKQALSADGDRTPAAAGAGERAFIVYSGGAR